MPFSAKSRRSLLLAALILLAAPLAADEIGDALDASGQAQRASRESQARIDKLDNETRKLREQRREAQWRAMQQSAYAKQLEQEAAAEEAKRAGLEQQIAQIAGTEKELLPLMQRMVAELETFVAADLPFLAEPRRKRVEELKALLTDPSRSAADKYRRVLEAYRTEVDYGHSVGVEDEVQLPGVTGPVALVRIGRVGLYYLSADGASAGAWDAGARRWRELEDAEEVRRAVTLAQGEMPPELLVLPVQVAQ